jgi:LysM repeat protein
VRWGDWLYRIARAYGVSAAAILRCNHIPNPNYLRVGQQILIPGGPQPTTTPTPRPSVSPTPRPTGTPGPCNVYIVRPGDTLSAIARRFGTTVRAIMDANGLVNPNYIFCGQRLVIPGAGCPPPPSGQRTYIVRYGDTLWGIALRFGVSLSSLAVANNLSYPYIIYAGQTLIIP